MFGPAQISKMNTLAEVAKQQFRARGLNNPKGHPKDAEKGRARVDKKRRSRTSSTAL